MLKIFSHPTISYSKLHFVLESAIYLMRWLEKEFNAQQVLIEHEGNVVDFHWSAHPYH